MSHRRKMQEKQRWKKLAENHAGWMGGAYYDEDKHRYIRYWASGRTHRTKYWKNQCNRKIRRQKTFEGKGNSYRRQAEFRWQIW